MVMAAITPSTDLMLLKCPLEVDQQNQLTFANATAQYNYFSGLPKLVVDDFTYQRKDSTVRFNAHIDSIRGYNYCMYRNSNYGNKWFYAFITDMKYLNDEVTLITLKTDVWQSWLFDIEVKASFVEREHTNDDSLGTNTLPEDLELGEYVESNIAPVDVFNYGFGHSAFVIGCTKLTEHMSNTVTPISIANIPDGLIYLGFDNITDCKTVVEIFNGEGHGDYINCIFTCPKSCFTQYISVTGYNVGAKLYSFKISANYSPGFYDSYTLTADTKLAGDYTPRNKKLLTYPYRYVQMSNNAGSVANYRYEYFKNPLTGEIGTYLNFDLKGYSSPGCDIKVYPTNYKGITYNYDEGLSFAKLAVGSWASDVYTNWLAQNGVNIAVGFAADLASLGIGMASFPAGGGVAAAKGFSGIASTLGQIYQHAMQAPQAEGATNIGNVLFSQGRTTITFKQMSIRPEYSAIVDKFFDMYGYATHKVKVPNINGRTNWNFVKCLQANVIGDIPQDDMQEIKQTLNEGITFWHNPSTYLDYSQTNAII